MNRSRRHPAAGRGHRLPAGRPAVRARRRRRHRDDRQPGRRQGGAGDVVRAERADAVSTFLYADPHFFHASVLKFCPETRAYASVAEMNDAMASAWRKVVKPTDEVIVVGDFAHRADPNELKRLFDSLPGKK